jgi:hypothetical protein
MNGWCVMTLTGFGIQFNESQLRTAPFPFHEYTPQRAETEIRHIPEQPWGEFQVREHISVLVPKSGGLNGNQSCEEHTGRRGNLQPTGSVVDKVASLRWQ